FAIEEVLPRENELVRAGPGGRGARIVAANLDRAVVVLAASEPPWDPALADRFLALVESAGVTPVLVVNKVDLPGGPEAAGEVASHLGGIGYRVLPVSARTGVGIP